MIAFDTGSVKTTSDSGENRTEMCQDTDCCGRRFVLRESHSPLGMEAADYSAIGLIKFIEGFFHKHVRLRRDGEPATVALAIKVKHMVGELVKLETTPRHSCASNPAERAVEAVEEQTRTIRADCQMRFGNGEAFLCGQTYQGMAAAPCGWQISRYKQKGNGMTAYKQAYGEHYTHEVVPFAEVILVMIPKPTPRALQGGKRWYKGDAVFIKRCLGWKERDVGRTQRPHSWRSCALANNSKTGAVSST